MVTAIHLAKLFTVIENKADFFSVKKRTSLLKMLNRAENEKQETYVTFYLIKHVKRASSEKKGWGMELFYSL